MTTDDEKLAQAVAEARKKYGPNMTPAQRAEAAHAYALDYAMKAAFGLTFDELAAKTAKEER